MRVPGIHVLLTAGIVAVTSIGTVAAFSLTGSSEAEQRLPAVAPPPAAAAPLDPAPLPVAPPQPAATAPVVAPDPTTDAAPAAEPQQRDEPSGDRAVDTPERRPDPPRDRDDDKPKKPDKPHKVKADPNGTDEQKLAYACRSGMFHGKICKQYM